MSVDIVARAPPVQKPTIALQALLHPPSCSSPLRANISTRAGRRFLLPSVIPLKGDCSRMPPHARMPHPTPLPLRRPARKSHCSDLPCRWRCHEVTLGSFRYLLRARPEPPSACGISPPPSGGRGEMGTTRRSPRGELWIPQCCANHAAVSDSGNDEGGDTTVSPVRRAPNASVTASRDTLRSCVACCSSPSVASWLCC